MRPFFLAYGQHFCAISSQRGRRTGREGGKERERQYVVCVWENERIPVSSSPYKGPNPTMGAPPPWPHPKPNYLLKSPTANTTTSETKASTYKLRRTRAFSLEQIQTLEDVSQSHLILCFDRSTPVTRAPALCWASSLFASGTRCILTPEWAEGQREAVLGWGSSETLPRRTTWKNWVASRKGWICQFLGAERRDTNGSPQRGNLAFLALC